jgi:hypothetical protein
MGPSCLKWFLPFRNSLGTGLAFPVSEDVRGILRGMRSDLGHAEGGSVVEDEEDDRVWRRDGQGGWMTHD